MAVDGRAALKEALRIWWVKFLLYFVLPNVAAVYAGHFAKLYAKEMPPILHIFVEEASHYLPIVGLIGIGAIMLHHGLKEMAEHSTPEFTRDVSKAIEALGPVLAACIANKQFITPEMLESALRRPQPLVETDDPALVHAKELFDSGRLDDAIAAVEQFAARKDVKAGEKEKAERLLLQFGVYGNREEQWKKAESVLPKYGSVEMYGLLAFKYWTAHKLAKAIPVAEVALEKAIAAKEPVMIARAKNNLAYYLADAKTYEREADARRLAAESKAQIEQLLAKGEPAVSPVLVAKFTTTVGFVLITYSKSVAECLEGLDLCSQGVKDGADPDLLSSRHMVRFTERMTELRGIS